MKTNTSSCVARSLLIWACVLAVCGASPAQSGPQPVPPQPPPLGVSISAPDNGQSFGAPANIVIRSHVTGVIDARTVEYFAGASSIGTVTNAGFFDSGFNLSWPNVPAGDYSLTAVVIDRAGATATSAPVNITITNVPLAVALEYPANGEVFNAPGSIGINSRVSDSQAVQTVQYFSGAASIGIVSNLTSANSTAHFFFLWTNVAAGSHTITAVATDSAGVTATSAPVSITVTNIPLTVRLVSPTNGQSYAGPANIGINASVTDAQRVQTVRYFAGTNNIGTVTNGSDSDSDSAKSFFFSWNGVAAGAYSLTAVATDGAGTMATSAPVNIIVTNNPLAITIVSPTNGQSYGAMADVPIYSRVSGTFSVKTVEYFSGTNSIGIVTNTPVLPLSPQDPIWPPIWPPPYGYFFLLWTNVGTGNYTLTAVATDSSGIMATSAPVTISVSNNPLAISLLYPTNGQSYAAPANVEINSSVSGPLTVKMVEYFAGAKSIGIVTNSPWIYGSSNLPPIWPPNGHFPLLWANVGAGGYILTAVATDSSGTMATSAPVNITVTNNPLAISLVYPTNGQIYAAPANVGVNSRASGSVEVRTVQYFVGGASIGIVTNPAVIPVSPITPITPPYSPIEDAFFLLWTNVAAGNYTLTAVATDLGGNMATSAPVNITVTSIPLIVSLVNPTNGETYAAPANISLEAAVRSFDVKSVQFFVGGASIGIVTNPIMPDPFGPPAGIEYFLFSWTNVPAGNYTLTAVATDGSGTMSTSAPVNITVTNAPLVISMTSPQNGQTFLSPAGIGLSSKVSDPMTVKSVQYFEGATAIGTVTNTNNVIVTYDDSRNPFFFDWTNVQAGTYTLTAVATDAGGVMATSAPVTIFVVSNLPPVVRIYAPDPIAIEGTNDGLPPVPPFTNSFGGTNTATFLVQRTGGVAGDLIVFYSIGGTASNGVDYALIPNMITIPAGQTYAMISIVPLPQSNNPRAFYETVILTLIPSPAASPVASYNVGVPSAAEVIILEDVPPITRPGLRLLGDSTVNVSVPAANGKPYCVQVSSDLVNWVPVCTNTAVNGAVQYTDPNAPTSPSQFYRIVPAAAPASY